MSSSLSNISAIVQKEWRHYFGSPIAYVILFVWSLLTGVFFINYLGYFMSQTMRLMGQGGSLGDYLIRPVLHNMAVSALFLTPMLTMRLFAEEKRQGTMELLATAPITDLQILLGKVIAAFGIWSIMVAVGFANLLVLWKWATPVPEWRPIATSALAMFLVGACYIVLGAFLSSVTKNQIVAGLLSFCLFLGSWLLSWINSDPMASPIMKGFAYLSFMSHFDDMLKGVIDLKDLVYYASIIFFGIFISHQAVASERWRG